MRTPLPPDARTTVITIGGERYVVLSHPTETARDRLLAPLSSAERAVVLRVVEGWTQADIAAERNVSPRTVAKQLESAYRRLGVSSKAQLTVMLSESDDDVPGEPEP